MFYKDIKGIILVHDLSNNKSYKNLWKWLQEIMQSETFKSSDNGFKSGQEKKIYIYNQIYHTLIILNLDFYYFQLYTNIIYLFIYIYV